MAKSKKKAKLSRFSRFSKQQMILATVFILGFGGIGGYYIIKSYAAWAPGSFAWLKGIDVSSGRVSCRNTAFHTGYGTIVYNCVLSTKTSTGTYTNDHYVGNYIVATGQFQKTGPSVTKSGGFDARDQIFKCANMDNYFAGQGYYTGYGYVYYGYVYSWYGAPIAKPAYYAASTKNCTSSGDWQKIYTW
jgi:hypothetical protein